MSDAAKPATGAARADRTDRRPDGSAVRVMVVDDEPSLAELMASVLRYEGWEVRTAGDGLERCARRHASSGRMLWCWMSCCPTSTAWRCCAGCALTAPHVRAVPHRS